MSEAGWVVPFYLEDGTLLCELKMTSIPSEGPTFAHTDGKRYKIVSVEGDRKTKEFKVIIRHTVDPGEQA